MAPQDKIDVLILGSGGREHALLKACLRSPRVGKVRVAPGNGGMALEAECLEVDINSGAAVLDLVRRTGTQFVIVGPEVPLAHGVVDVLEAAGVKAYGPLQAGARLEAARPSARTSCSGIRSPPRRPRPSAPWSPPWLTSGSSPSPS